MAEIPQHTLNIYTKPAQGETYQRSFAVYQYKHRRNLWGDDSASCKVFTDFNTAQWILENCVGNSVRAYVDDPMQPTFDGFISRITFEAGGFVFTSSLDDMYNRTDIEYFDVAAGALATAGAVNVNASQNIYMVKEGRLQGELVYSGGATARAAVRAILLAKAAWPVTSFSPTGQGISITVELRGWYHIWDWEIYTSTNVGALQANVMINALLANTSIAATANFTLVYATGTGTGAHSAFIQTNAAFTVPRRAENGQTYLEFAESIVDAGDGTNPWVCGITRNDSYSTPKRFVYYRPGQASTVAYYQRAFDEPGVFRDSVGRIVKPWNVEADRIVQVTDVLFAWELQGQDPRACYMETVDYDSDSQTVTYTGADDVTLLGSFGQRRRFKIRGRNKLKNAPVRWRT